MAEYRLFCTRRNRDGSYDVPSVDHAIEAADDQAAIAMARRFPRSAYGEADVAWIIDRDRRILWSNVAPVPKAA